jgi:DNA helicase-2/ATP-dependent DNA helicase PcrA
VDILQRAPWIRDAVVGRYVAVICDEYQDTGNDQDQLLRILAEGQRLICLADGDQMIYDFRPDVGPRRLAGLRALGPIEIPLEAVSHRDPTGVMPALAAAIRDRQRGDAVVTGAIRSGRLRIRTVDDPWDGAIEEVRELRRAGHGTVGVFVSKREYVEELSRAFASASIQHEIAGLDGAAGEAQGVIATMAACAVGDATFESVRERIAVFLTAAQARRTPPSIAIALIHAPGTLPAAIQRRLEVLEGALRDLAGEPVADLFQVASDALSIYGWGQGLWRLGVRDLYGQALDVVRRPLDAATARDIAAVSRASLGLLSFRSQDTCDRSNEIAPL